MDILDKIDDRYGIAGVMLLMITTAMCALIIIGLWIIATGIYVWPIVLPFVLLGYIVWSVKNG